MTQIIYDMSEVEYHALDAISATQLKMAATGSLYDLKQYLEGQYRGTKDQRIGWLCHMKVNTPGDWERVAFPPDSLTEGIMTKDGKRALKPMQTLEYENRLRKWEEANVGKIHVTQKEYMDAERIAAALTDSLCFTECTATEVVVLFDFMGVPAKCRIDGEVEQDGIFDIYDWKFMTGTRDFQHKLIRYGYHLQGAFYKRAYETAGRKVGKFYLVAVDKKTADPAYTVCAPMSNDLLALGGRECEYWFNRIQEAKQTNFWPAADSPGEWDIPGWYTSPTDLQTPEAWIP